MAWPKTLRRKHYSPRWNSGRGAECPDNPGAWLTATAKRRGIDLFRRNAVADRKYEDLAHELATLEQTVPDLSSTLDDPIGDDLLRLVFIACHPILSTESRSALTLRLLGGLTTAEIGRAFLTPETTIAQRIVRAKRTLAEKHIPFEVPRGAELGARLSSVLEVIYLIFNEGYSATAGDDLIRPALCEDALRLGRILAELAPEEPEVHGLVALMEIQASRTRARIGPTGEPILLLDQNRAHWDLLLIRRGLAAIDRATNILNTNGTANGSLTDVSRVPRNTQDHGPYLLQAEIAACHARAHTPEETDWQRIVSLYTDLAQITPSPVIELNRAVAVSMADGPQAALNLVEALALDGSLDRYHLLPSVRADLLYKLGRAHEARTQFELAASLTQNSRERALLLNRASACQTPPS